jgi:hypothetical protein
MSIWTFSHNDRYCHRPKYCPFLLNHPVYHSPIGLPIGNKPFTLSDTNWNFAYKVDFSWLICLIKVYYGCTMCSKTQVTIYQSTRCYIPIPKQANVCFFRNLAK